MSARFVFLSLVLCLSCLGTTSAQQSTRLPVAVAELPSIPATEAGETALGYAGMVGGRTAEGTIIAAGGANFPEGLPWQGGPKRYSDRIYLLDLGADAWRLADQRLPMPLAYGASVTLPQGVLIIGGENSERTSDEVYLLRQSGAGDQVNLETYPSLPEPLAYTAAVAEDGYVYVIGGSTDSGSTSSFYRLAIDDPGAGWERLTDFPGPPRSVHAAAVQETPYSRRIFVIGGRSETAGERPEALTDYLSYDLTEKRWYEEGPLLVDDQPTVRMGASAQAAGTMHVMLYGGSDEVLFDRLVDYSRQLATPELEEQERQRLTRDRDRILKNHPGFSRDLLAYNTITKKWFVYDTIAVAPAITALSFFDGAGLTIVSGETSPGIRTPAVRTYTLAEASRPFGIVNYTVLGLYLLVSVLIGVYFSRKQNSTEDYFTGGGRIPWWASGLSVFGTLLSAITFMAIPAKSFTTDWSFFMLNITAIMIAPVIAYVFIPFFNQLKIRTAYEYLEERFNYGARVFGSLSFILFQLGRIGIVLLLPSLAISIVTGFPVEGCILLMGVLCILYTTFGGIEAVIWTDVLQVAVLLGGSILSVIWISINVDASWGEMIDYAADRNKFNIIDWDLDFTTSTFWVVVIGGLASALVTQGTDQTIVQRYLTSDSVQDARRTLYTNAVMTLPATIIFFGLGTLLFIFYSEQPSALSASISNNDSIFPWYIVRELPVGVSGLLIAGIFSAAMSSISSSLNSVSTAYCNDFYQHYRPQVNDLKLLRIARYATVITGVIGVLLALWMANSGIKSLWDQFYRFLGLFTGGLGGLFLLGMLTKRANGRGALLGVLGSAILIWYVSTFTPINFLLYSFIGLASCFVLGYGFSLLWAREE